VEIECKNGGEMENGPWVTYERRKFKSKNNHNGYTREYPVSLEFVVQRGEIKTE